VERFKGNMSGAGMTSIKDDEYPSSNNMKMTLHSKNKFVVVVVVLVATPQRLH